MAEWTLGETVTASGWHILPLVKITRHVSGKRQGAWGALQIQPVAVVLCREEKVTLFWCDGTPLELKEAFHKTEGLTARLKELGCKHTTT